MLEERSPLQTNSVICVKLDQGEPEERIRECLDIEDELFAFCVEFAIENNLIIKQKDGSMRLQSMGKSSNGRWKLTSTGFCHSICISSPMLQELLQ